MQVSYNWPQAAYLKRMAQKGDLRTQHQVLEIMLEVSKTDNYYIHRHFTEAALSMPIDMAEKWAEHEIQWIRSGNKLDVVLSLELGKLISKLTIQGKPDIPIRLAKELLAISPSPAAEGNAHFSPEPLIRVETYEYEEILKKNIPDLGNTAPFETLEMLCGLLEKTILYSMQDGEKQKPRDLIYISRPSIENHEQNRGDGVDDLLINAIRDTGENICKKQVKEIFKIVRFLESYGWNIFIRIGLYLFWVIEEAPFELIRDRLLNRELFNSLEMQFEYYQLLRKYFGKLSPKEQLLLFSWIDDAEEEKKYLENKENNEEQREKRLRWWQYEKLIIIQDYLIGEWKSRFLQFKRELGKPRIPLGFIAG